MTSAQWQALHKIARRSDDTPEDYSDAVEAAIGEIERLRAQIEGMEAQGHDAVRKLRECIDLLRLYRDLAEARGEGIDRYRRILGLASGSEAK